MRQLTSWEALITSLLLVKNAWGFNNVNETLLHLIEQTGATGEPNRLKLLETLKYWAEKVEKGHRPCFCVGVSAVMADVRVFSDVTYLLKRVTSVVLSDDFVAVLWSMILTFERLQESQRRCCWEQRLSKLQTDLFWFCRELQQHANQNMKFTFTIYSSLFQEARSGISVVISNSPETSWDAYTDSAHAQYDTRI